MTHPTKEITTAQITEVTPLTEHILQVNLTPELYIDYIAGQYLKIMTSNDGICYSIANAPLGAKTYELHIKHFIENEEQQQLMDAITQKGELVINLPFGQCTHKALSPHKPILFIAGGTGFAPIKAMIEQLLTDGFSKPFELYWSARTKEALYLDEQAQTWENHVPGFSYHPFVSNKADDALIKRILKKHPKLKGFQIVLAGPFPFVYAHRDSLLAAGASPEQLFSDAFEFENQGI